MNNFKRLFAVAGAVALVMVLLSNSADTEETSKPMRPQNTSDFNVMYDIGLPSGYYKWLTLGNFYPENDSIVLKWFFERVSVVEDTHKFRDKKLNKKQLRTVDYILRHVDEAAIEYLKRGILPSIKLAQATLESSSGDSYLAKNANNHFGIKCFNKECRKLPEGTHTEHCFWRPDDTKKDRFLRFNNVQESYAAHSMFLSRGRYDQLFSPEHKNNWIDWTYILRRKGYATDKSYDSKLRSQVRFYGLEFLDNLTDEQYYSLIFLSHEYEEKVRLDNISYPKSDIDPLVDGSFGNSLPDNYAAAVARRSY